MKTQKKTKQAIAQKLLGQKRTHRELNQCHLILKPKTWSLSFMIQILSAEVKIKIVSPSRKITIRNADKC